MKLQKRKRVVILTAKFGLGHLAIAAKLKSHLESHPGVEVCDIIDLLSQSELGARSSVSYQKMCEVPRLLREMNPLFFPDRVFPRYMTFWSAVYTWLDKQYFGPYGLKKPGEILATMGERIAGYDVVFSTACATDVHIKRALAINPALTTVSMNQNLGGDILGVYAQKFWTYFLAADEICEKRAKKYFRKGNVKIARTGPIYYRGDYDRATDPGHLAATAGKRPTAIILVGRTGVSPRYLRHLGKISQGLIRAGYTVVFKSDGGFADQLITRLSDEERKYFDLEPFGPISDLNKHQLVVAKGSYNQSTEAVLWGVPFAASNFLAFWEEGTRHLTTLGAAFMDFSREVTEIPSSDQLAELCAKQRAFRDQFILPPSKFAAIFDEILGYNRGALSLDEPAVDPMIKVGA